MLLRIENAGHNCTCGIDHTGSKFHTSSKGIFCTVVRGEKYHHVYGYMR